MGSVQGMQRAGAPREGLARSRVGLGLHQRHKNHLKHLGAGWLRDEGLSETSNPPAQGLRPLLWVVSLSSLTLCMFFPAQVWGLKQSARGSVGSLHSPIFFGSRYTSCL